METGLFLFAVVIPITLGILYFVGGRKVVWWEFLIPILPTFLASWGLVVAFEAGQTMDTAYKTSWVSEAQYDEDWNERCRRAVYRTQTYSCGKGRTCTRRVFSHYEYYTVYHPAEYRIRTASGGTYPISKSAYHNLAKIFGNETFVELNRSYYTDDGDRYVTHYKGEIEKLIPASATEGYENRVQASSSIFRDMEVDKTEYPVYDYPPLSTLNMPYILGPCDGDEQRSFQVMNARMSMGSNCTTWLLIFKNQPYSISQIQEAYWKGGNYNELVVCVGVGENREVEWSNVFGWTENDDIKIELRNLISAQKQLNPIAISEFLQDRIPNNFKPRDFKEFDYLKIEVPWYAYLVTILGLIILNVGIGAWLIKNEFQTHEERVNNYRFTNARPVKW